MTKTILLLFLVFFTGCTIIVTDDILYGSLLKDTDFDKAIITPAGTYIEKGRGATDPNDLIEIKDLAIFGLGWLAGI